MELPHLGEHCSIANCKKLDFLPVKCDACSEIFCEQHSFYLSHDCKQFYLKDNQVPVCPLCNKPIPVGKNQQPDAVVGAHIDTDCQSDPAKNKRKIFNYACSHHKCKTKEIMPFPCPECGDNFCLAHRNSLDHKCQKKSIKERALIAALARQKKNALEVKQEKDLSKIQGKLSEDEALAKVLAMSMEVPMKTQEELDFELAKQLQANEDAARLTTTAPAASSRSIRDRCNLA